MEKKIEDYIRPGARAHLVGIGGVSMAPLAEVLKGKGVNITGSDMKESAVVDHLRSLGIPVTIGHLPGSVEGADCVIRTAAVHDDNPEIAAALSAGIPVFERAQAWAITKTPCAWRAPTARPPPPPCAPTSSWPPAGTPL